MFTMVANGGMVILSNTGDKLPAFKISNYHGDRLNGDKWIRQVESAFCSTAMDCFLQVRRFLSNKGNGWVHLPVGLGSQ